MQSIHGTMISISCRAALNATSSQWPSSPSASGRSGTRRRRKARAERPGEPTGNLKVLKRLRLSTRLTVRTSREFGRCALSKVPAEGAFGTNPTSKLLISFNEIVAGLHQPVGPLVQTCHDLVIHFYGGALGGSNGWGFSCKSRCVPAVRHAWRAAAGATAAGATEGAPQATALTAPGRR